MSNPSVEDADVECALLWRLARGHGWSSHVSVRPLVSNANVHDERKAREVARDQLAARPFVGYHQGRDEIWLTGPPGEDVFYHLRDDCGYSELQIEATFSSYFEGFDS